MLICESCGEIFDEGALKTDYEPHGEPIGVCPMCGSSFLKEAKFCRECHEQCDEEDLTCGWCDDCIEEKITLDSFLEFGLADCHDDEPSIFEQFMYEQWLGMESPDVPNASTAKMKEMFVREYDHAQKWEETRLLTMVECFVMNKFEREFAEWLEAEEARAELMNLGR